MYKFLQYDAWNSRLEHRGVGIVELCSSRLNPSPSLMAIPGKDGEIIIGAGGFSKHFLKHPSNSVNNAAMQNRGQTYLWDSEFSRVDWERGTKVLLSF